MRCGWLAVGRSVRGAVAVAIAIGVAGAKGGGGSARGRGDCRSSCEK